ncbi:MAG: 6-hydroxynicotinate reductase [Geminicoccaceae bacterium]
MSNPDDGGDLVTCDACPVLCRIRPGRSGACDRYGNVDGRLARLDPIVLARRAVEEGRDMVPFLGGQDWDGGLLRDGSTFLTGIGAGTTYPDYKPAPFIVSTRIEGIDTITVVTEGIFSYCGIKVKIDTDRYVGPETAAVRVEGEQIGHVTTAEYGSQMLSLGGVRHLTGGSKKEGRVTCASMLSLLNREPVSVTVDGGAELVVEAGKPPVVNGKGEERMRVGCGSATIGIFARQWHGHVDEVIVVDDHITGVLTEHQAGRFLGMKPSMCACGAPLDPGPVFPGCRTGAWLGRHQHHRPARHHREDRPRNRLACMRLLFVSTTGEHSAWYTLDDDLVPCEAEQPGPVRIVTERIAENCEPAPVLGDLHGRCWVAGCARASPEIPSASPARCARHAPASPRAEHPSMSGRAAASPTWSMSWRCRPTASATCRRRPWSRR